MTGYLPFSRRHKPNMIFHLLLTIAERYGFRKVTIPIPIDII